MKKTLLVGLACTLTFSAYAAEMMDKKDFEKVKDQYQEVGHVSISGEMNVSDAKTKLSKMADEKGGEIYVLTSANTDNKVSGTAIVYKKK